MRSNYVKQGNIDRILSTSRVVWDNVVAPGWLDDKGDRRFPSWNCDVDVFRVAEAMSPLVGLACTRELRRCRECPVEAPHYEAIRAAAVAGSPSCVAWIIARTRPRQPIVGRRGGGSSDSRCWLVHRMRTIKEATCVVDGLCEAGNVEAARIMFGSGGGGEGTAPLPLWDGRVVPQWGWGCDSVGNGGNAAVQLRNDLRESVMASCDHCNARESFGHRYVIRSALRSGSVETVKWFVSAFGIGWNEALWVFTDNLRVAALRGHIEVIKWVLGEFNLIKRWSPNTRRRLAVDVLMGDAPNNIKWCIDNFQLTQCNLLLPLLNNERCTSELCQWLQNGGWGSEKISLYSLQRIKTFEFAKWALSASPEVEPGVGTLNEMCRVVGDVKFVEWLVTEKHFIPTASTFVCACSTLRGGCALPQWLSTRVELQPADLQLSLQKALCSGNIEIANWLESHFGVMESVNSCATLAEEMTQVCLTHNAEASTWFLRHLSPEIIKRSFLNTLRQEVKNLRCDTIIHLLEACPGCMNQGGHSDLFEKLLSNFMNLSLAKLQKFVTLVDCSMITKDLAAKCLINTEDYIYTFESSKAVKWAITYFSLESIHIKMDHNRLLFRLMVRAKKTNCALWLIDTFGITMDEVVDMFDHWLSRRCYVDFQLEQWKMLLHKFPTIDIDTIRQHFMPLVISSPATAQFTVYKFGFTIEELDVSFTIKGTSSISPVRRSTTKAWLDSMLGREVILPRVCSS